MTTSTGQDERLLATRAALARHGTVAEQEVDPDISSTSGFLKLASVQSHRWAGAGLAQVGALRMTVRTPTMDALTVVMYPELDDDAPIFLMFFLVTGSKVISHFNLNTPFGDDPDFAGLWLEPQRRLVESYPPFDGKNKVPDWIAPRMHPWTVYGLFKQDRADELTRCAFEALEEYLTTLGSDRERSPERLRQVAEFHADFKDDIRTKDKAQGISSKFIGKDKARRIFYEVVT